MRVLHVAASLSPEWGGPVSVVENLSTALIPHGVECAVFAAEGKRVGNDIVDIDGVDIWTFPTGRLAPVWTAHAPSMVSALQDVSGRYDVFHIHELWHYPAYVASEVARESGVPYIVTIHGGLDAWALGHKALKKRVYMRFAQRKIINCATGIHAITQAERDQVIGHGYTGPVDVIPNGIGEHRVGNPDADGRPFSDDLADKRVVLFLGRVHPKKGLDILADAFAIVAKTRDDARLVIAGPDEAGQSRKIASRLEKSGVLGQVIFTGMLTGIRKARALATADVFVLPSYSEGFSMAVLEAMATGLPVVISRQCYFPEVDQSNAGIVVETRADELAVALGRLLDDPGLRREMGQNGQEMIRHGYTWDSIASRMTEFYRSVVDISVAQVDQRAEVDEV